MSLKIVRGPDAAPMAALQDATVSVLGYGNQGRAHALNLRDSGIRVLVANRERTAGAARARADGFAPLTFEEAAATGDLLVVALPDEAQGSVYAERIGPHVRDGAVLGFLHGFAVRFGLVRPSERVGVVMVAPKGPGRLLRERYVHGHGLPCLLATQQEAPGADAEAIALAWAAAIGCARAGIIYTTFAEETETDLFGEQTVLCGGLMELILAAFETLVAAGYAPELAYLECCHEVKQIADLVYDHGLAAMTRAISNTAEFGAYDVGPRIVDEDVRRRMREVLDDVRSGAFAGRMQEDHARDFRWFKTRRRQLAEHPIEPAGEVIRALMRASREEEAADARE